MATPDRLPRLAVLIDADNASARIADGLFVEIAKIGEASVRRIYGDFTSTRSKAWVGVLQKLAIQTRQTFPYTVGKNASDIALVIDAMDLLHGARVDGFCLVSSDSDFTDLAARIREQGMDVYGFGERKTPESFRQACKRFIYTENLIPEAPATEVLDKPDERPRSAVQSPSNAVPLISQAIAQFESDDGWVALGGVGQRLGTLAPDFDPRTYGSAKLRDLVEKSGAFETRQEAGRSVYIRLKAKAAAGKKKKA